jgi:hypothetical protein
LFARIPQSKWSAMPFVSKELTHIPQGPFVNIVGQERSLTQYHITIARVSFECCRSRASNQSLLDHNCLLWTLVVKRVVIRGLFCGCLPRSATQPKPSQRHNATSTLVFSPHPHSRIKRELARCTAINFQNTFVARLYPAVSNWIASCYLPPCLYLPTTAFVSHL